MNDMPPAAALLNETRDRGVVVLTLNYQQRRNALSMAIREGLIAALDRIEGDASVRAIVNEAAEFATHDAEPDPSELYTDVYR